MVWALLYIRVCDLPNLIQKKLPMQHFYKNYRDFLFDDSAAPVTTISMMRLKYLFLNLSLTHVCTIFTILYSTD